jgi:hypothetical protein
MRFGHSELSLMIYDPRQHRMEQKNANYLNCVGFANV